VSTPGWESPGRNPQARPSLSLEVGMDSVGRERVHVIRLFDCLRVVDDCASNHSNENDVGPVNQCGGTWQTALVLEYQTQTEIETLVL
jgi:hypothetical protein